MKKLFYLIGLLTIVTLSTSCKKSWTCECTTTEDDNGQITTTTSSIELTTYHKGLAKTECSANATTSSSFGYTVTTSCKLK